MRPRVIAHRGASGAALENTLTAFRLARALGADGVELDVHATADARFAVHHDAEVPGLGPIAALPWDAVAAVPLPGGERIPELGAVLDALDGLEVYVEVKAMPAGADAALLRLLERGPTPAQYAVHSFDHAAVTRLGQLAPALPTGLLVEAPPPDPATLLRTHGARTLWPRHDIVDAGLVAEVHDCGGTVITWTVNRVTDLHRVAAAGVDGVCTDHPDRVRDALRGAA